MMGADFGDLSVMRLMETTRQQTDCTMTVCCNDECARRSRNGRSDHAPAERLS